MWARHLWSSCSCSAEHPTGHSRMDSAPLEGHGQCHHFLTLHHLLISSSLELLWEEGILLPQYTQAGWGSPWAIFFPLCSWQPEGHSLPVGHPFDLNIAKALVLRGERWLEFFSSFWHSFILLQLGADPLNCVVWVGFYPLPGFLGLLGRESANLGHEGWRRGVLGALVCLAGFASSGSSGCSRRDLGPLVAWHPHPGGWLPPLMWGRSHIPLLWVSRGRPPWCCPH